MLVIDAPHTSGFRDLLYYFRCNPLAHKLNATQPEKEYLINIGKLGLHLRTHNVTHHRTQRVQATWRKKASVHCISSHSWNLF